MAINRILRPTATKGLAPSHSPPDMHYIPAEKIVRFLAWFSVGLGVAEIAAPSLLSRVTGVKNSSVFPPYGAREIACGLGLLLARSPAKWLWGRVAGDACDLATLTKAYFNASENEKSKICNATLAVLGVTGLDVICAATSTAVGGMKG